SVAREHKTQAMEWFTPEQYAAIAEEAGFVGASWQLQETTLSTEALEDIGQFSMFIEGALPGVPLEIGAEALRESVRVAMNDVHMTGGVPRYWLQFITHAPA
ncbi:MAG TPA: hypothetical protein VK587_17335, partial [bacterium]|nr:hypothetical protein [bacterium]